MTTDPPGAAPPGAFASALLLGKPVPWSAVKGFNYQPSYGSSDIELWLDFDEAVIDRELGRGRELFPKINALRWWLSWNAYKRDPAEFADRFERALQLAEGHGLAVMPVLFNRWHSPVLDYGGIYIDHFLPGASWVQSEGMFDDFLERIVGAHRGDHRIFVWDVCNEPYAYTLSQAEMPRDIVDAETRWLESLVAKCKALDPATPVGISIHPLGGPDGLRQVEAMSDVLLIHPYFDNEDGLLDAYVAIARAANKPLLGTEVCWGSFDDAERVEVIEKSLSLLSSHGIGWLAYLLNHSRVADSHRPEDGPLEDFGFLQFIEADGALRPGHDVFNKF